MNNDTTFDWLGLHKKPHTPQVLFTPAALADLVAAGLPSRANAPPPPQRYHLLEELPQHTRPSHGHLMPSGFDGAAAPGRALADQFAREADLGPLSLTAQDLTLAELKTYMRWYLDILLRTSAPTITIHDVFNFLHNFRLAAAIRDKILSIFARIAQSINIGEFFAMLRVIAHAIRGEEPLRQMIRVPAPVPVPPSILLKKRVNDDREEPAAAPQASAPLDLDSFTQFILTGDRPSAHGRKKAKLVKFSDQVVTHDQAVPLVLPTPQPVDMSSMLMDQLLQMRSGGGEPERQPQPQSYANPPEEEDSPKLLQPNMTGPAQMAEYLQGDTKLLQPNMTGPAQMAKFFDLSQALGLYAGPDALPTAAPGNNEQPFGSNRISLQSFTAQMTGATQENTNKNADMASTFNQQNLSFFHSAPGKHQGIQNEDWSQFMPDNPQPPPPPPGQQFQPFAQQTNAWPPAAQPNGYERPLPPPPPPVPRGRLMSLPLQTERAHANPMFPSASLPQPLAVPQRQQQSRTPPPPPPRRRNVSHPETSPAPALPPKIELGQPQLNWPQATASPPPQVLFQQQQQQQPQAYQQQAPYQQHQVHQQQVHQQQAHQHQQQQPYNHHNLPYQQYPPRPGVAPSDLTSNILDDLKALQEEVDKIRDMTGGF